MLVYKKENGEYEFPLTFEELKERFPYTSFSIPLTQSALPEGYFFAKYKAKPKDNSKKYTQGLGFGEFGPEIDWIAEDYTEDEVEELKKQVQHDIEQRFKDSAWAMADDVPVEIKNKYKEYRTKLWDVTKQLEYPFNVEFPEV